jgi:exonuclease SbcC
MRRIVMKIVKLKFKNLNSLKGEWSIDFSSREYQDEGIFAITGSTGAGKSTILDGIALALYGKTPRLERINKEHNEIMSKGTGECFSELIFDVGGKLYQSRFYQSRARKKGDGNLQTQKREVSEVGGKVLETKLKHVTERIERITGLDYERFTRSILLAQGEFSSFLKSSADEKAPILEQITGTEIYSFISIKSFERAKEERIKVEKLEERSTFLTVLDDDERDQLIKDFDEKQSMTEKREIELKSEVGKKDHLLTIDKLKKSLVETEDRLLKLQSNRDLIEEKKERLELGKRVLEIEPYLQGYEEESRNQLKLRASKRESEERFNQLKNDLEKLSTQLTKDQADYEKLKTDLDSLSPIMKEVIAIDSNISSKSRELNDLSRRDKELDQTLQNLEKKVEKISENLETYSKKIYDIEKYQSQYPDHKDCEKDIELIKHQFVDLENRSSEKDRVNRAIDSEIVQLKDLDKQCDTLKLKIKSCEEEFQDRSIELEGYKEDFLTLFGELTIEDLKNSEQEIMEKRAQFLQEIEALSSFKNITQNILNIDKSLDESLGRIGNQRKEMEDSNRLLSLSRDGMEKAEKIYHLTEKVKSLKAERDKLIAGEPCPLCGSKDHPYGENSPSLTSAKVEFEKSKANYEKIRYQLEELNCSISILEERVERSRLDRDNFLLDREAITSKYPHFKEDKIGNLERMLQKGLEDLKDIQISMESKITDFKQRSELLSRVGNQVESLEKSLDKDKQHFTLLSETRKLKMDKIDNLKSDLNHLQKIVENIENNSNQLITKYIDLQPNIDKKGCIKRVESIADRWRSGEVELSNQKVKRERSQTEIAGLKSQIEEYKLSDKKIKSEILDQSNNLNDMKKRRLQLFEDKDPELVESTLKENLNRGETVLSNTKERYQSIEKERYNLELKLSELVNEIEDCSARLKSRKDQLEKEMLEQGFRSIDTIKESRLDREKRESLESEIDTFEKGVHLLKSSYQQMDLDLKRLNQHPATQESLEDIIVRIESFETEISELKEIIGGIREKLKTDDERRAQSLEIIERINREKEIATKWEDLSKLIGSADGKKYRNFAQGLTFQIMVGYANRELQKMSDRYILLRDKDAPLDLQVVDNYQAGEIRSTKNLSGGESFIVSLSLALGLSKMASNRISVDSLFLDEGFGTLDEDSLEVALSTLSSLNDQGKSIGVISHISSLKERIGVKISVTQKGDGFSKISGPGVSGG